MSDEYDKQAALIFSDATYIVVTEGMEAKHWRKLRASVAAALRKIAHERDEALAALEEFYDDL